MKYIITEHQRERTIKRLLSYYFEPHEVNFSKKYPDSIFWIKNGEVIAEIDKSKNFWVSFPIWKEISDTFSLEYKELQRIIKEWLDEHYNLGRLAPHHNAHGEVFFWDNIIKSN